MMVKTLVFKIDPRIATDVDIQDDFDMREIMYKKRKNISINTFKKFQK